MRDGEGTFFSRPASLERSNCTVLGTVEDKHEMQPSYMAVLIDVHETAAQILRVGRLANKLLY